LWGAPGEGRLLVLSLQQIKVLQALAIQNLSREQVHHILYDVAVNQAERKRALTGSERAALSRMLRLLTDHKLIVRLPGGGIGHTNEGLWLMDCLQNQWRGWGSYANHFLDDQR